MGLLDNLRGKAGGLGGKALDGLETVKDKAADGLDEALGKATDVIDDVKDRFDGEDTPAEVPASETSTGATGSAQGAYDEVLRAAELVAETRRTGRGPV